MKASKNEKNQTFDDLLEKGTEATDEELAQFMVQHYEDGNKPKFRNSYDKRWAGLVLGAAHGFGLNHLQTELMGSPIFTYVMAGLYSLGDGAMEKYLDHTINKAVTEYEGNPQSQKDLENALSTHENGHEIRQHIHDRNPSKGTLGALGNIARDSFIVGLNYGLGYTGMRIHEWGDWFDKIQSFF
jgi:hypothetical protein